MTGVRKTLFRWSAKVSRESSRARETGKPAPTLALRLAIADKLVLSKIRPPAGRRAARVRALRRRAHDARGGPLLPRPWRRGAAGLRAHRDHSGALRITRQDGHRGHLMGKPIAGCSLTLADDGEILARASTSLPATGTHPKAGEVMRDGWFATGDLGEIVDGVALTIVGRKKELLVLSSGKNVQPAVLEDAMRSHPAIQDTIVVGEGRHFVSALVALDEGPACRLAHCPQAARDGRRGRPPSTSACASWWGAPFLPPTSTCPAPRPSSTASCPQPLGGQGGDDGVAQDSP